MKMPVRLIFITIIAALVLPFFALSTGHAEELSPDQKDRIRSNCVAIKGSLNQLHASDALLRVNRGQIYESMGTKLMGNFNSRLGSNGMDNKGLVSVANSYQLALATFRSDYQVYEQQLAATIKIDCVKDPTSFHGSLESARSKRLIVHDDVVRLNQYIDDYRSSVSDFMLNFERVTGGI